MAPQTETKNATTDDFGGSFAQVLTQIGKARLSADRLASLGNSGLVSDIARCPNPHKVDRATLRRVLAGEKRVLSGALEIGGTKVEPPPGGRIHLIGDLPVDERRVWAQAIASAGPNTHKESEIHQAGRLWTPETELNEPEVVSDVTLMVNFGQGVYSKIGREVARWASAYPTLRPATPRRVLAVAEFRPLLHREVGMDPMGVVSPDTREVAGVSRAVVVWWGGSKRDAFLGFDSIEWHGYRWFVFACGSPVLAL